MTAIASTRHFLVWRTPALAPVPIPPIRGPPPSQTWPGSCPPKLLPNAARAGILARKTCHAGYGGKTGDCRAVLHCGLHRYGNDQDQDTFPRAGAGTRISVRGVADIHLPQPLFRDDDIRSVEREYRFSHWHRVMPVLGFCLRLRGLGQGPLGKTKAKIAKDAFCTS